MKISKGKTSFTRLQSNRTLASWHDEIDAIIAKKGCFLTGFKNSDCTGDQEIYGDLSKDGVFDDLKDFGTYIWQGVWTKRMDGLTYTCIF